MDIPTDPTERIAFLEQQLAGAVMFLNQKDATEAACVERLEGIYKPRFAEMREIVKKEHQRINDLEATIRQFSARYAYLRQYMVQVWKLGIAASGERLDEVLDEQIERLSKQRAKEIA